MTEIGFTSIPFKTESGLSSINGLAKFSRAGIVFEFESKLFGVISAGVKEVRLPLTEILDIKFRKGVFKRGAKIEVRTKSLAKLTELPNNDGKVTLKLSPDDHERASNAVANLQKDLEFRSVSLPPAHTAVSVLFDAGEDETDELPGER
jgi:hypothetical protein